MRPASNHFTLTAALVVGALCTSASAGETKTLMDFDEVQGPAWQTVNDGVMGGLSRGGFDLDQRGLLVFRGEISLDNNGGFSSIRSRRSRLDVEGFDGLEFRVKGDGRGYKVSLRTEGTRRMIAYWAELKTTPGVWTRVRIPFSEWVPTSFGRKLRGPKLRVDRINSVGFMLYDKKAGPFTLEVDRISAYKGQAVETKEAAPSQGGTIAETAQRAGAFKTLLAAAKAAGLVPALTGDAPLTVFAPSDEAFAALPAGTVASLLRPENKDRLRAILTYHVVSGRVSLADLAARGRATTLNGQRVTAGLEGGALQVSGATIQSADLACSNGVIHVIDRVLLPKEDSIVGVAAKAKTFNTLLAAAKAAGLAPALAGKGPFTVFAPSDAAFAALPEGTVEHLLQPAQRETLVSILKHHVVSGRVFSDGALAAGKAKTLAGTTLTFGYQEGALRVAGVKLTALDLAASNGVIHVVEQVLLPPQVVAKPKPALSVASARRAIEEAVREGVPLYNGGNEAGCRDVYVAAVKKLLTNESLFSSRVVRSLRRALRPDSDAAQHAWTLRYAMDAAYENLANQASR
jgi:transforming growth factor-beta-induced protein